MFEINKLSPSPIVAYSKISFRLRHNQIHRIHPLQGESQVMQMNIARYRKAVYGALWVQAALVDCYLPLILSGGGGGVGLPVWKEWECSSSSLGV